MSYDHGKQSFDFELLRELKRSASGQRFHPQDVGGHSVKIMSSIVQAIVQTCKLFRDLLHGSGGIEVHRTRLVTEVAVISCKESVFFSQPVPQVGPRSSL